MKTYDFDRIVDRHGTNAVKYDTLTDVFGIIGNRCRRLIPAILPHTDKADRLIALWRML